MNILKLKESLLINTSTLFKNKKLLFIVLILIFDLLVIYDVYKNYNNYIILPTTSESLNFWNKYKSNKLKNTWVKAGKEFNYYYIDENGYLVMNDIIEYQNKKYYLDKKGKLITNKIHYKINKNYYNILETGELIDDN